MEGIKLTTRINREFLAFFSRAVRVARGHSYQMCWHLLWQTKAAWQRSRRGKAGFHVPAFAIYSITQTCNLLCTGCYYKQLHTESEADLPLPKINEIITEAEDLGISIILIAGGEPFTKKGLIGVLKKHSKMVFPIFTNGTLITPALAEEIGRTRNVFPIISLEGDLVLTDSRRGQDVYQNVLRCFRILCEHKLLYGVSITLTNSNYDHVIDKDFVSGLANKGCKIVFYIEYVPCDDRLDQVISAEQRGGLKKHLEEFHKQSNMLFVAFPGDEDVFGGCLAAGRGFIHINHGGRVEPCPFSPFSDASLVDMTLAEALQSKLFEAIRKEHKNLVEQSSGCALWDNREWVENTLKNTRK